MPGLLELTLYVWVGLIFKPATPDSAWLWSYGACDSDHASAICPATDGGCVLVGATHAGSLEGRMVAVRLDSLGRVRWKREYNGGGASYGAGVEQTPDLGFVVVGARSRYPGKSEAVAVKLASDGDTLWTFTGDADSDQGFQGVAQIADGGYVMAGWTQRPGGTTRDVYLVRIDQSGHMLWSRTLGGGGDEAATCVRELADGSLIVAGKSDARISTGYDVLLFKTSPDGRLVWWQVLGEPYAEEAEDVRPVIGGYALIARTILEPERGTVMSLIRTDERGNTLWDRWFQGDPNGPDHVMLQTNAPGLVQDAFTFSLGGGTRILDIVEIDDDGNFLRTRHFEGLGYNRIKLVDWTRVPDLANPLSVGMRELCGVYDYPTETSLTTTVPRPLSSIRRRPHLIKGFGAFNRIVVTVPRWSWTHVEVHELSGALVDTLVDGNLAPGRHTFVFDGFNRPPGLYFVHLQTDSTSVTQKLLVLK
jgi:hypothetical protein